MLPQNNHNTNTLTRVYFAPNLKPLLEENNSFDKNDMSMVYNNETNETFKKKLATLIKKKNKSKNPIKQSKIGRQFIINVNNKEEIEKELERIIVYKDDKKYDSKNKKSNQDNQPLCEEEYVGKFGYEIVFDGKEEPFIIISFLNYYGDIYSFLKRFGKEEFINILKTVKTNISRLVTDIPEDIRLKNNLNIENYEYDIVMNSWGWMHSNHLHFKIIFKNCEIFTKLYETKKKMGLFKEEAKIFTDKHFEKQENYKYEDENNYCIPCNLNVNIDEFLKIFNEETSFKDYSFKGK